jgi:predicted Rossmann fold nucleotide-binding protein DprA/Smf involved in DNA uptake
VSEDASAVLARVRDSPGTADAHVRATGLDAGAVATALTELELAGLVAEGEGAYRAD